ncbi:MAG: membrane protein insertase YidC [Lactobacillales bacterium]|jgi:YidC/Oxa1 family membrane protein insertase|nr:membrane protein insertase YidC [Lactobacillales bacterium]
MKKRLDEQKKEQKNLFIAMLAIVAVLFLSKVFFPMSGSVELTPPTTQNVAAPVEKTPAALVEKESPAATPTLIPATAQTPVKNITIQSNLLSGSMQDNGGTLNNLSLLNYRETAQKDSSNVRLLDDAYAASLSWISPDMSLPMDRMAWVYENATLTPFTPVVMTWSNDTVKITRTIEMDEGYMFKITDKVDNLSGQNISMALLGQINRKMTDEPSRSTVHEGFVGYLNSKLVEERYSSVKDTPYSQSTTNGWAGLTDKYWQTIFVLEKNESARIDFGYANDAYRASFQTAYQTVAPFGSYTKTTRLFAGAKDVDIINAYEKDLGIQRFDLTIDYGWFYFLTKPFLYFLNWLYEMVGNMGIAILIFATLLRILLLPIATKSYESMAKMRKIQPKVKELQARYKDDRMRLQQETLALYKRDKVNPASGCLPLLLQIPVFFALYKVLSVSLHMRQAPFFGWITDLSARDPSSVFTFFGMLQWPIPSFLDLGVWPILMGITMYVQQRLSAQPMADKAQENMMKMMPLVFTFMLGNFASGLVIYWTWSNILSILQQKYIMKKVGV